MANFHEVATNVLELKMTSNFSLDIFHTWTSSCLCYTPHWSGVANKQKSWSHRPCIKINVPDNYLMIMNRVYHFLKPDISILFLPVRLLLQISVFSGHEVNTMMKCNESEP